MISLTRSFNLKVLGWFWLTLLLCTLSIIIPAYVIQQLTDNDHLRAKDREIVKQMAVRIDEAIAANNGNITALDHTVGIIERRMPYQWFVIDNNMQVVGKSAPLSKSLVARFDSRRFWYFMQSDYLRDVNIEWTRLMGPAPLPSHPELKVVLWRSERPRLGDIFRSMPWWSMAAIFVLVTSLMSYLLVRSIAAPLNRLGQAFNAVGQGQLSHKVNIDHPKSQDKRFAANAQFARLFEQFNDMTARITALIQNQRRQSADISHELRTPLTRLQMTLALVRKKSHDETILPLLERAERESELLNLHIKRLSDLTTMEAQAIQQGRQLLSANELLDALCEDAAFEAKEIGIDWQHTLCDATLNVYEEPFATAIENVVRNAFKYARSAVTLWCEKDAQHFTVIICDDGPGVAPDELDKLTKAFYRTDSARNSDTGGLGLGLAITAEAMRLNQGQIAFALTKSGGLKVTLTFALHQG